MERTINLDNFGYKKVSLEITTVCNFKCIYCPYGRGEVINRKMMPWRLAFHVMDELSACGGSGLEYIELNVLGEPLMHPDLLEIIGYAHSKNIRVKLITNGSLFSEKNINNVLNIQPEILKISFETFDKKDFSFIRGTDMLFEQYLDNVIDLIKRRLEYGDSISTLIQIDVLYISRFYLRKILGMIPNREITRHMCSNKKHLLEDAVYFLDRISKGCDGFVYNEKTLIDNFSGIKNSKFSNNVALYKISDKIILTLKEYYPWVNIKDKCPVDGMDNPCKADNMGILADGSVVLCCLDYQGETRIGNIFDNDLKTILSEADNIIRGLREGKLVFEKCRKCLGYFSWRHRIFMNLRKWFK